MTTDTPAKTPNEPQSDPISATEVFPLLADDRRRYVLHYLRRYGGTVSLEELAEQIAIWEDDPTYDHYERVLTSLYHTHLPRLVDGGMIRYDVDRETVTAARPIRSVRAYLDLARGDDLQTA